MRRVWFSRGHSVSNDIVSTREVGSAPFILLIQYLPPVWGRYRLKAHVRMRDADVAALINRHRLDKLEIYVDRAAEAVDARQASLREEFQAQLSADHGVFALSPHRWAAFLIRQAEISFAQQRVVRVSFGRLLRGIEVKGQMRELSWLARALTQAIDKLAAQIDTGRAFDVGEIRIYAPGTKQQSVVTRPNTPPSQWGT